MRPSATIISIVLFVANALFIYFWLFDTKADLKNAETQIRKQAFNSVKEKIEKGEHQDERLNPNLQKAFQKPNQSKRPQPETTVADAGKKDSYEEIYASFVEGAEDGMHLWCRPAEAKVLSFPARCMYSANCYRCDEGTLIQPDDPNTNPFCSDGQMGRRFDTECCPSGLSGDTYRCPDMPSCLSAESVPVQGCTCGGDNCRYAPSADNAECVCN